MTERSVKYHGVSKAKGCRHASLGSFSRLFPDLSPLAVSESEAAVLGGVGGVMHDVDDRSPDNAIPAGYTFFAQFIDHDVTLDTTSPLRGTVDDVRELPNLRTATLDLDCVYGFGPEASPHIYDPDRPGRILENPNGRDVARSSAGVALIGDPRNDENIFVSQMQLLFHRFHNAFHRDRVYQEDPAGAFDRFEEAQTQVRYHYQWLVLFDFLKRVCDREVFKHAARKIVERDPDYPYFYTRDLAGTMPVEFSVAAYRVGHSMVRSVYAANAGQTDVELFEDEFDAVGFTEVPAELEVDWAFLLPVDDCVRPRMGKAIDSLLANELQNLPVVPSNNPNDRALAFRNLLRGNSLGLPSGQDVAQALSAEYGYTPPSDLGLEHCNDRTPLFLYVLAEAQALASTDAERAHAGERFGPTGSAILMEVFGGMLLHCGTSFVTRNEEWNPDPCVSKERWSWWSDCYRDGFSRDRLIEQDDYYPFELADVVRFVEERVEPEVG